MRGFFTMEMIEEFEKANIDYEKAFRESVDEVLEEAEDDRENQYQ
jgi:predicted amino acid-binding ACT domain protein